MSRWLLRHIAPVYEYHGENIREKAGERMAKAGDRIKAKDDGRYERWQMLGWRGRDDI